jgi:transposase-like protein
MDERLRFVAKLLDGESMSYVCREFGISRKTGYKIFARYKQSGLEALSDRSRRPVRYANQLPPQIEGLIVTLKRNKPHGGRAQDSRAPGAPIGPRPAHPGQEHDPRRVTPRRPGPGTRPASHPRASGTALPAARPRTICGAPTSRASSGSATGSMPRPTTSTMSTHISRSTNASVGHSLPLAFGGGRRRSVQRGRSVVQLRPLKGQRNCHQKGEPT